ncbi:MULTISPECIES: hypothetical protein [unclassified Arenibacter]|jgi:hypothetical protein|uniref:hypothetical protein n=1 Tax=unclassified Arenibacter TaxID=2615047 RepID=UPI000E3471F4|nr:MULTISPECIES: hypothetical protein [unclassified Arenibacter]MCM4165270.1 hypothetical protein [Arenibacter sp. A80]RFT55123.1 hypothetical protein D0S24_16855 [Arenibacter sp. P308M17]
MKITLTIIFVLFIGMAVQAKNDTSEVKVEVVARGIVTVVSKKEGPLKTENMVARLYMLKNAKVTKALSFTTKMNKAKLA